MECHMTGHQPIWRRVTWHGASQSNALKCLPLDACAPEPEGASDPKDRAAEEGGGASAGCLFLALHHLNPWPRPLAVPYQHAFVHHCMIVPLCLLVLFNNSRQSTLIYQSPSCKYQELILRWNIFCSNNVYYRIYKAWFCRNQLYQTKSINCPFCDGMIADVYFLSTAGVCLGAVSMALNSVAHFPWATQINHLFSFLGSFVLTVVLQKESIF